MIPVDACRQNERWNTFENVATHSYARSLIQKNDKNNVSAQDDIQSKKATNTIEYDHFLSGDLNNYCSIDLMWWSQYLINNKRSLK